MFRFLGKFKNIEWCLTRLGTCDVLIIESRHSQGLVDALSSLEYIPISISKLKLWPSPRLFSSLVRYLCWYPTDLAYILAVIEATKAKVVISTDALISTNRTSLLHEVAEKNSRVEVLSVPHGNYTDDFDDGQFRDSKTNQHVRISTRVVLMSIGERDKFTYQRWGLRHSEIIPVGSLPNALYQRSHSHISRNNLYEICVIEKIPNVEKALQGKLRLQLENYEKLCALLHVYLDARDLIAHVALRPFKNVMYSFDSDMDPVRAWFTEHLGGKCTFTDPSLPFATHLASDQSNVTLGLSSTAVTESMGRGNKVLSMWTDKSPLGLPDNSLMFLRDPTYQEFEKRLDEIRRIDVAQLQDIERVVINQLIKTDLAVPTDVAILQEVRKRIAKVARDR